LEKELLNFKQFEMLSVTLKNENHLFKEKESKLESEIANLLIKSADDFRLIEKAQQEKLEYESKLNVLNQEIQVKQNTFESEVKEKNDLLEQVKNLSQTLKYENRLKKKNEEKINNLQHLQCLDSEKIEELVTCRGRVPVIPYFHLHLRLSIFGYGSIALSFLIPKLSIKSHKSEI
jgi:DNA repair exonuclease SbcCD ATPase subunit